MSDAVIVAMVTAGLSLLGTVVTVLAANRSTLAALDKKSETSDIEIQGKIDVIRTEIRTLSDRVEKHNGMIERTAALERRMAVAEERVKVANHRLEDLERGEDP